MESINVNEMLHNGKLGKFHLKIFVLLFVIMSFDGYDMGIYGATLPVLLQNLQMNASQAGLIGSCALIGAAVGALLFGFLADKFGRKKTILFGVFLFSAGSIFAGFSNTMTVFGLFRFLSGLGLGGVMPNVVAMATEYAPGRKKAMVVAAIFSGMQIGGILASGLTLWLLPVTGWRAMYLIGGLPLLFIPFLLVFLPESAASLVKQKRFEKLKNILEKLNRQEGQPNVSFEMESGGKSQLHVLFKGRNALNTILIWIIFFMNMYMAFGLGTWLPQLMINSGFQLNSGVFFLLTLNLAALAGSFLAGMIADRIGYKITLGILYLLAFLSIILLSFVSQFYLITVLVALAGIGFFGGQNVANSYVSMFYPPAMRSTGMGFAFGLGRLGAIFGPSITGFIVSLHLTPVVNFAALAIPGLIAACAVLAVYEKSGDFSGKNELSIEENEAVIVQE
ncbi:UNVERIFIED_ORG: AAHS family benzoate transporter-like MFS transporter [Heyndrickxia coagulans]